MQEHKHEPDFSFDFKGHDPREMPVLIRVGEPDEKRELRGYPSEYLFRKYINKENPKYHFSFVINGG